MKLLNTAGAALAVILVTACDTGDSANATPEPDPPPSFTSCSSLTALEAANDITINLPANFQEGSNITIDSAQQSSILSFDSSTGELTLAGNTSRLPQTITYTLRDDQLATIETHTHNLVIANLRIMPLGDSITQGIDFFDGTGQPPIETRVGYRQALYNLLSDEGITFDFVGQAGQRAGQGAGLPDPDNNGYPGVDIDFIDNVLPSVLSENSPDIILLHIGTNQTPGSAEGLDQIMDQIDSWASTNSNLVAFVATLTPKRDTAAQQIVDAFNTDLRMRVEQRASNNIVLVDMAAVMNDGDISLETIGIHPNESGYLKMAQTWFDALQVTNKAVSCS
jgi:lysophospholipase L1-like esterase